MVRAKFSAPVNTPLSPEEVMLRVMRDFAGTMVKAGCEPEEQSETSITFRRKQDSVGSGFKIGAVGASLGIPAVASFIGGGMLIKATDWVTVTVMRTPSGSMVSFIGSAPLGFRRLVDEFRDELRVGQPIGGTCVRCAVGVTDRNLWCPDCKDLMNAHQLRLNDSPLLGRIWQRMEWTYENRSLEIAPDLFSSNVALRFPQIGPGVVSGLDAVANVYGDAFKAKPSISLVAIFDDTPYYWVAYRMQQRRSRGMELQQARRREVRLVARIALDGERISEMDVYQP